MAWLCDTSELVPSGWLSSLYAGHGVRGDAVPSTGTDGPSALYPCISLPADSAVEVRGYITRWPTLGTLEIAEDGGFVYTGASDYFEFRLYADGVAETDDIGYGPGIVRVTLGVGAGGAFGAGAALGAIVAGGALASGGAFSGGATLAAVSAGGTLVGDTSGPAYADQPETSASWSYKQTATLWRLVGGDAWGGQATYAPPVLFLCDYAAEARAALSPRGEEFTTRLLVYTSLPNVEEGDMVMIGESSSLDPFAAGADEIRAVTTWADTFKAAGPPDFRFAT